MSQGSEGDAAASRRRAGRIRTDATIRREREQVDRILGHIAATFPAGEVEETRRETDSRLSVERDRKRARCQESRLSKVLALECDKAGQG